MWHCRAQTVGSRSLAWVLVALASFISVVVFCRMSYHHFEVMLGRAAWNEPLDTPRGGRRPIQDSPRAVDVIGGDAIVDRGIDVTIPEIEIAPASGGRA